MYAELRVPGSTTGLLIVPGSRLLLIGPRLVVPRQVSQLTLELVQASLEEGDLGGDDGERWLIRTRGLGLSDTGFRARGGSDRSYI